MLWSEPSQAANLCHINYFNWKSHGWEITFELVCAGMAGPSITDLPRNGRRDKYTCNQKYVTIAEMSQFGHSWCSDSGTVPLQKHSVHMQLNTINVQVLRQYACGQIDICFLVLKVLLFGFFQSMQVPLSFTLWTLCACICVWKQAILLLSLPWRYHRKSNLEDELL